MFSVRLRTGIRKGVYIILLVLPSRSYLKLVLGLYVTNTMWLTNKSYIYDLPPFKKFFRTKQSVLIFFRKNSTELKVRLASLEFIRHSTKETPSRNNEAHINYVSLLHCLLILYDCFTWLFGK